MEIVVKSTLDGNAPEDPQEFARLGGWDVLRAFCGNELAAKGCEVITFEDPKFEHGRWTIIGKGETDEQ